MSASMVLMIWKWVALALLLADLATRGRTARVSGLVTGRQTAHCAVQRTGTDPHHSRHGHDSQRMTCRGFKPTWTCQRIQTAYEKHKILSAQMANDSALTMDVRHTNTGFR